MSDVTTSSEATRKAELKEKVRALEAEKSQLENEIVSLKDNLEVIELERRSISLGDEIGTLQVQKTLLEEKFSHVNENIAEVTSSSGEGVSEFQEISTKLAETTTEIESAKPEAEIAVSSPVESIPLEPQQAPPAVVVASTSTTEPVSENQSSSNSQ